MNQHRLSAIHQSERCSALLQKQPRYSEWQFTPPTGHALLINTVVQRSCPLDQVAGRSCSAWQSRLAAYPELCFVYVKCFVVFCFQTAEHPQEMIYLNLIRTAPQASHLLPKLVIQFDGHVLGSNSHNSNLLQKFPNSWAAVQGRQMSLFFRLNAYQMKQANVNTISLEFFIILWGSLLTTANHGISS